MTKNAVYFGGLVVAGLLAMAACTPKPAPPTSSTGAVAAIPPDKETDPQWQQCESADAATQIAGCGAIIAANTAQPVDLAVAYNNRGYAYHRSNEDSLAIADYGKAIQLDPNNAFAYVNRGQADISSGGSLDQACADFSTAVRLAPNEASGYSGLADVYANRQDWPNALASQNKALQADPNYLDSLTGRGGVYLVMQQWDLAIADETAALRIDPNSETANMGMGEALNRKGQFAQAIPYFTQVLALNRNDALTAGALYNRAVAKLNTGDPQGATADETAAKQLNPNVPDLPAAPSG